MRRMCIKRASKRTAYIIYFYPCAAVMTYLQYARFVTIALQSVLVVWVFAVISHVGIYIIPTRDSTTCVRPHDDPAFYPRVQKKKQNASCSGDF